MDVFLGLDLGTTNCKIIAIDTCGQPIASLSLPTPAILPAGEGASVAPEYDAEELWQTSARLIRHILEKLTPGQHIAGVAVASMGEAGVLVDQAGAPLAAIMTWYDHRTLPWVDWWRERISEQDLYRITGLPLGHTFSANKLLWLRQLKPQVFAQASTWLCLADWITFRLTGRSATSYCMASRTMLFDLRSRDWSHELLRLADLPPGLLPPALPSGEIAGLVTRKAARETGLPSGVPVSTAGHDHICAALAVGAFSTEVVLDSAGTAEALMITLDTPLLEGEMAASGLACGCHTARDRFYLIGGIMGGGVLAWASRMLAGDDSAESINLLMEAAASSPPGANGVWFIPYLEGSGPPRRDPNAWGGWLGLRRAHTRADLARAVVEGVSFGIRFALEILQTSAGKSSTELRCVGGGTRNPFWQQVKADVIGTPIDTPAIADVTAQGAALLAGIGAGAFVDEVDAAQKAYRSSVRYEVDRKRNAFYDPQYRKIFKSLNTLYQTLPLSGTG
jgi:xylulokinase